MCYRFQTRLIQKGDLLFEPVPMLVTLQKKTKTKIVCALFSFVEDIVNSCYRGVDTCIMISGETLMTSLVLISVQSVGRFPFCNKLKKWTFLYNYLL